MKQNIAKMEMKANKCGNNSMVVEHSCETCNLCKIYKCDTTVKNAIELIPAEV